MTFPQPLDGTPQPLPFAFRLLHAAILPANCWQEIGVAGEIIGIAKFVLVSTCHTVAFALEWNHEVAEGVASDRPTHALTVDSEGASCRYRRCCCETRVEAFFCYSGGHPPVA